MTTKTVAKSCAHYWLIGGATGPVSKGTCRLCGATRKFANSFPMPNEDCRKAKSYPLAGNLAYSMSTNVPYRQKHYGNTGVN